MMRMIYLLILISVSAYAENYAVVSAAHVDLLNDRGVSVKRLFKGTVVKIKTHDGDRSICRINDGGRTYYARRSSLRVVTNMLNEESRLKKQLQDLNAKMVEIDNRIDVQSQYINQFSSKILELEIWIEVQRDLSYSREYFQEKTKGSFAEVNIYKEKISKGQSNLKELYDYKESLAASIKNIKEISTKLSIDLLPVKREKNLLKNGFIALSVKKDKTPVYSDGKIIKYLKAGTVIKAQKDSTLDGWYVFSKGSDLMHISSYDVKYAAK